MPFLKKHIKQNIGGTAIEYGLIIAFIGLISVSALSLVGLKLHDVFCEISPTLDNTNGCDPIINEFNKKINSMVTDLKKNEENYIKAWKDVDAIVQQANNDLSKCHEEHNQDACNEYTALTDTNNPDSPYMIASQKKQEMYANMTWANGNDSTSLAKDLDDIFNKSANASSYNNLSNTYGSAKTLMDAQKIMSQNIIDPITGTKTSLNNAFNLEASGENQYGVTNEATPIISNFLKQYPYEEYPNI